MQEIYRVKTSPVALSDNMIIGEKYRITVLTEALVRLEYSEDGVFDTDSIVQGFSKDRLSCGA